MSIIIQSFEIFIRKRLPSDIDYNLNACLILCFAAVFFSIISFSTVGYIKWPAVAAATSFVISVGLLYYILKLNQKEQRFVQMLTAMLGVGLVCNLISVVVSPVREMRLLAVMVQFWGVYLNIVILKHTLESSFIRAFAITVALLFITLMLLFHVFGDKQAILEIQGQIEQQATQATP